MEKINSVKISSNGRKVTFRSDEEKIKIINEIKKRRLLGIKIFDSCKMFGIRPNQYYMWSDKYLNKTNTKSKQTNTVYEKFKTEMSVEIKNTIQKMYIDWLENSRINEIRSRLTDEIINKLVIECGLSHSEILGFINKKIDLPFSKVNKILYYVNM